MSRRRKHLAQSVLHEDVKAPEEGQCIVRALGTRGGNIVEVEHPCGKQTLCILPARFNKKLWVRRGGYLIVQESSEAAADGGARVTGTIDAVLYADHVRQLRGMPGIWPNEFAADSLGAAQDAPATTGSRTHATQGAVLCAARGVEGSDASRSSSEDDDLPPLQQNSNRRVVYHTTSSSDDEHEQQGTTDR